MMIDSICELKASVKLSNAVFKASEIQFSTLSAHNKRDLHSTYIPRFSLKQFDFYDKNQNIKVRSIIIGASSI